MRLSHRKAVLALMLASGIAQAQTQGGASLNADLELSVQQRARIYQTITKQPVRTPPPPMQPSVGAGVPPATELYAMPDNIAAEIPATKIYRYTMVQNQVVIVDPTTLKVVDVLRP